MLNDMINQWKTEEEIGTHLWILSSFWFCTIYWYNNIYFVLKIQDLEATIHKKDMELNDLNARYEYYHSDAFL